MNYGPRAGIDVAIDLSENAQLPSTRVVIRLDTLYTIRFLAVSLVSDLACGKHDRAELALLEFELRPMQEHRSGGWLVLLRTQRVLNAQLPEMDDLKQMICSDPTLRVGCYIILSIC